MGQGMGYASSLIGILESLYLVVNGACGRKGSNLLLDKLQLSLDQRDSMFTPCCFFLTMYSSGYYPLLCLRLKLATLCNAVVSMMKRNCDFRYHATKRLTDHRGGEQARSLMSG